jgi:hypothetical protein
MCDMDKDGERSRCFPFWNISSAFPLKVSYNNIFICDGVLFVFMIYLTSEHPVAEPEMAIRAEIRQTALS